MSESPCIISNTYLFLSVMIQIIRLLYWEKFHSIFSIFFYVYELWNICCKYQSLGNYKNIQQLMWKIILSFNNKNNNYDIYQLFFASGIMIRQDGAIVRANAEESSWGIHEKFLEEKREASVQIQNVGLIMEHFHVIQ